MPKLKTNKSAAKRFKKTATGKFKHRRTNRNHILTKKQNKRKRQLRSTKLANPADTASVERMLRGS